MIAPAAAPPARVAVAMIGARRHYAVPVLLDRAGLLARLYTDAYPGKGWLRLARPLLSAASDDPNVRRLLRRRCNVPTSRITAFNTLGMRYWWRLTRARSAAETEAAFMWAGDAFARRACRTRWNGFTGIYGFNSAARRLFEHARATGVKCILDQTIAPRRIYEQLLNEEARRWPTWIDSTSLTSSTAIAEQEQAEWDLADTILAGSQFVLDGLVASGAAAGKCRLVPYGTDTQMFTPMPPRAERGGPLRVLFVGSVGLRKGVPYLLQAARTLGNLVRVRIVGPLDCPRQCLDPCVPDNTQLTGPIPRGELRPHFEWADVLCLPSLCEGSAAVTYEARAAGLPVVCTPNAGATVEDGVDGFVVPVRNVEALVARFETLARDRNLLEHMGAQAARRSPQYGWEQYGRRLVAAVADTLEVG